MLEKETVVTSDNNAIPIKDQRLETINVDMTLTVTPWVSGNNEVTMDVSPNFDVPGASNDPKIPPPVNRRSLRSTVRVKDGEMIVLGGLISESESITLNKVPLLGDIPFLKWIFSSKKKEKGKTQMMIYLIPHVYYGSEQAVEPKNVEIKPGAMLTQNIKSPQEIKERELNKDIRTGKRQLRSEARHKRWKERIDRLKNRRKHRDMDKENHDKEGDAGKDTQPQTGTPVRSPKEENTSKTVSVKE
jgi:type II secretory pathway component GspD/PulD (secretin)